MTSAQRRQKRRESSERNEGNQTAIKDTENTHIGIGKGERDSNQKRYFGVMALKCLVELSKYVHEAEKHGISLGEVSEIDIDSLMQSVKETRQVDLSTDWMGLLNKRV